MTDMMDDPTDPMPLHVAKFASIDPSSDWQESTYVSIPVGTPLQQYQLAVKNDGFPSWPFQLWSYAPDSQGNPIEINTNLPPSPGMVGMTVWLAGGWQSDIFMSVATGGQPVPPGASLTLMLLLVVQPNAA